MSEFYTIETPPSSSSTSKDSMDDSITLISKKNQMKLFVDSKTHEFESILHDEMNTPLRRSLGNTKLKTRQDVRRFRKFLKRNHNIISTSLLDIEPDTMRKYLIDYLTSIRTRKGSKYDPETLRSYYLSIQRFLKDSNYPYCLRSSPQFAQCRDLIIQMRKEKNQIKLNDLSSLQNKTILKKTPVNDKQFNRINSTENFSATTYIDLLPSSSLPPRKRQQMKYFLETNIPCDVLFFTSISRTSSYSLPSSVLSLDAYLILMKFTSSSCTSSQNMLLSFEKFLDESPACGQKQRTMLTTLCHQWTGDIRIIHANLRPEVNSFLPHILLINILAKKY